MRLSLGLEGIHFRKTIVPGPQRTTDLCVRICPCRGLLVPWNRAFPSNVKKDRQYLRRAWRICLFVQGAMEQHIWRDITSLILVDRPPPLSRLRRSLGAVRSVL